MNNQELFAKYEEYKNTIKKCEMEMEALRPQIMALIPEDKEVEGQFGIFNIQQRPTWKYSKFHAAKKAELKEIEESEKAKGIAEVTYTPVLYYVFKK